MEKNTQDLEMNMHSLAKKACHGLQLLTQGQDTLLGIGERKWQDGGNKACRAHSIGGSCYFVLWHWSG